MADNLKRLGVSVETGEDYMAIEGTDQFRGNVRLTSFGDHRTAMSCAVAGLVAQSDVIVEDLECVQTSFPNFFDQLNQVRG
jgi:3-phosphoshikimate 1-carboxyvinyltransferase